MTATTEGVLLRVPTRYGDVVARRLGEGPLVLALHGGLGLAHDYLLPSMTALAASGYGVVLPDHPGNGRSRPVTSYPDMDGYADACVALMDEVAADRAVLLGHSYGGFIALQTALSHPGRVAGLVLVGTGPAMRHWDRIHAALKARTDLTPQILRGFNGVPFPDEEEFRSWLRGALPLYLPPGADATVVTPLPFDQVDLAALNHGGSLMATWDVRPRLGEIRCPAFVVTGQDDVLMSSVYGQLAAGLPRANAWFPAGTGHFPFDERREEFLDRVLRWLHEEVHW